MELRIKRVYEHPDEQDGYRVLVDRLWPRGLTKERARVDLWLKDIAPSTALRKWFGHDAARWESFKRKYLEELKANADTVAELEHAVKKGRVTLLYGARDMAHNEAVVLREFVESRKADGGNGALEDPPH